MDRRRFRLRSEAGDGVGEGTADLASTLLNALSKQSEYVG